MTKRPVSVTVIGWLFIAVGIGAIVAHSMEQNGQGLLSRDFLLIVVVELLAVLSGVFMLRGNNWARWLALAWMALHVAISVFHPVTELAIHTVFLALLLFFLLRHPAAAYFRHSPV